MGLGDNMNPDNVWESAYSLGLEAGESLHAFGMAVRMTELGFAAEQICEVLEIEEEELSYILEQVGYTNEDQGSCS